MSFIGAAREVLDRTEASLCSLIADALNAQAYREINAIASMAESLSTIPGRSDEARKPATEPLEAKVEEPPPPTPSWVRRPI